VELKYRQNPDITPAEFIDLLNRSTLAKRRPVDDDACISGMVSNADIIITAEYKGKIVGVARSVTDYHYCCYLSDLAVDVDFQKQGIGQKLIEKTEELLGEHCKIILLSAPDATGYYPKIGFTQHQSAWTRSR
jgi:ribosomal protein S18 acetylase RimI-like enzyme